jgi:hypothetical protein
MDSLLARAKADAKAARQAHTAAKRQRKGRVRISSNGGALGGKDLTPAQRHKIRELEAELAEEIVDAATDTAPDVEPFDRFDILARWAEIVDGANIPARFGGGLDELYGNAGEKWLERFLSRHGLELKRPPNKRARSLAENRAALELTWETHAATLRRAEASQQFHELLGIPARIVCANCDETWVRYHYKGLRVAVPKETKADPQNYATPPDARQGFSLLGFVSSCPDFYVPPAVVAKVPKKRAAELVAVCSTSTAAVGQCVPTGNKNGKAWLTREEFKTALIAVRTAKKEHERRTGEVLIVVLSFDSATIHKVDEAEPEWTLHQLEAEDIYPYRIAADLTSLCQPMDCGSAIRSLKATCRRERWEAGTLYARDFWDSWRRIARDYSNPQQFRRLGFSTSSAAPVQRDELSGALRALLESA